jgi:hypothetical protein
MEECPGRSRSEPSDLDWKTRQPLDLFGVTRGLRPQCIGAKTPRIDLSRPSDGGHVSRDLPFREIGSPGNKGSILHGGNPGAI